MSIDRRLGKLEVTPLGDPPMMVMSEAEAAAVCDYLDTCGPGVCGEPGEAVRVDLSAVSDDTLERLHSWAVRLAPKRRRLLWRRKNG